MAVELGIKPVGRVEIHVGDQVRRFDNLVLDSGWQSLLARMDGADGAMVPNWLHFGTGESEPQASDSGLAQRDAGTAKAEASRAYGGFMDASTLTSYSEVVVRFDYAAGELTGTWTELGLSYDQAYAEPYNRALILDENRVPVPLIVLSDQPVTVYARLRLHLLGWGRELDLSQNIAGLSGTLTVDSNIASDTSGLWLKGFPVVSAEMGGATGKAEGLDTSVPTVKQYFAISPWGSWSASRIAFKARDGVTMLTLDFSPDLTKPDDLALYLRVRITINRG